MIGGIVEHGDLQKLTGYSRLADIEACLTRQGVPYFRGRRGLWTTLDALNRALGLPARAPVEDEYQAEEVL